MKSEKTPVKKVIKVEKSGITNAEALTLMQNLRIIENDHFGVNRLQRNLDVSRVRLTEKLIFAVQMNIELLEPVEAESKKVKEKLNKNFRESVEIDEALEKENEEYRNTIDEMFADFVDTPEQKANIEAFEKKSFSGGELYKVDLIEIKNSLLHSDFKKSLELIIKK